MKLLDWLSWWMRYILPVLGWRVTVKLLRGPARGTGREVVLLSAGHVAAFMTTRIFAQEPVVERRTRVPVWQLQRLLDEWRSAADLLAVRLDRISARRFLSPHYLAVPQWLSSWMTVPEDLQKYAREHPSTRADIHRIRARNFMSHLSREPGDLDLFYEKFYLPYTTARYGSLAQVAPRWMLRFVFSQGAILWVTRGGERLSGSLVTFQNGRLASYVNGLKDGRMDLLKDGALSALYVHSLLEARRQGCTEFNMGGSRPSLHDGVFRYKSKWTERLCLGEAFVAANTLTLLDWNCLNGAVAEFLGQTSLIHHDGEGFSALWAFPQDQPLTAETLGRHCQQLKAPGLRRFVILLPGTTPEGFICPPGICLIEGAAAEKIRAGEITAFEQPRP